MATTNTPSGKSDVSTDVFGSTITVNFSTGEELSVDVATLAPNIIRDAVLIAVKNKLIDAAAIPRDKETGRTADVSDKYRAVHAVFTRITDPINPQWNAIKAKSEAAAGSNLLIRALMQMSGKTKQAVESQLESMTKEQRAVLKKNSKVAKIILELQLAGLQENEEKQAEDLLSGFGIESEPEQVVEVVEEPAAPTQKAKRVKKSVEE